MHGYVFTSLYVYLGDDNLSREIEGYVRSPLTAALYVQSTLRASACMNHGVVALCPSSQCYVIRTNDWMMTLGMHELQILLWTVLSSCSSCLFSVFAHGNRNQTRRRVRGTKDFDLHITLNFGDPGLI